MDSSSNAAPMEEPGTFIVQAIALQLQPTLSVVIQRAVCVLCECIIDGVCV